MENFNFAMSFQFSHVVLSFMILINSFKSCSRLFFNLVAAAIVYFTPNVIQGGQVPLYYYGGLLLFYTFHQVIFYFFLSHLLLMGVPALL